MAAAGVITRAARKAPWPLWLAPLLMAASTVVLLGEARLRTLIDPFMVLLAALALVEVADRAREARRAKSEDPGLAVASI